LFLVNVKLAVVLVYVPAPVTDPAIVILEPDISIVPVLVKFPPNEET